MRRIPAQSLLPAAALVLVLLALAGCGSGSSPESTDAPSSTDGGSRTEAAKEPGAAAPEAPRRSAAGKGSAAPGGTHTGDEVVDGFGVEAEGEERQRVVSAARAYFSARAADRWGEACKWLSASSRQTVVTAVRRFAGSAGAGCPEGIAALQGGVSRGLRAEAAEAELVGVRVKGENAFYVYRIPNGTYALLTMLHEDRGWRAAALAGTLIPPVPGR